MYDLTAFINRIPGILEAHSLGSPGAYRRWSLSRLRATGGD